ncbi:MAG: hypothetical protein AAGA17_02330 [Actinomycetota bacterium]
MHGGKRRATHRVDDVVGSGPSDERPSTALHGLRFGLPAAALLWAAGLGLVRRLARRGR